MKHDLVLKGFTILDDHHVLMPMLNALNNFWYIAPSTFLFECGYLPSTSGLRAPNFDIDD